jgi:DHA2 family multidrug resistance protein-like MFS transporter
MVPVGYAIKEAAGYGLTPLAGLISVVEVGTGVLFVYRQQRLPAPMFDKTLFPLPAFSGAVMAIMLAISALNRLLFFLAQYMQLVQGYGPLEAQLRQLPLSLASIVVAFFIGRLTVRLGCGRSVGTGLLLAAVGLDLLAAAEGSGGYRLLAIAIIAIGFGVGWSLIVTTDAGVTTAPPT